MDKSEGEVEMGKRRGNDKIQDLPPPNLICENALRECSSASGKINKRSIINFENCSESPFNPISPGYWREGRLICQAQLLSACHPRIGTTAKNVFMHEKNISLSGGGLCE